MPEELTTRDVFQQVDARLTRVEDDLRQLRLETISGFDGVDSRFDQVDSRIDNVNSRFDQLQWRVTGLFVLTWVTVIGSIWLKP
jgi:hypothetical protein